MDVVTFTDVACEELGVHYEEHGYGCPTGPYTIMSLGLNLEKSYLDKIVLA